MIQNEIVSHKGCKIVINKNIYYTELDIQACKNMHEMKEIKDKIIREIAWFERAKTHSIPPGLKQCPLELMERFNNIFSFISLMQSTEMDVLRIK